ncbi:hypothetical protein [Streptomyces sp. NPDC050856]|uniref:hypothetical protein n=1 Tax=unclassified Streptomyces TaxID=2593676 RepID=UPI003411EF62
MNPVETSRYVRLRVDLVLEITDTAELTAAAVERIDEDEFMPDDERAHARSAVREDEAEALAYLVEPVELVGEVPGVELVQASWTSEQAAYEPGAAEEWDMDEDDEGDDGEYPGGEDDGARRP